jgi:hypothetical protein
MHPNGRLLLAIFAGVFAMASGGCTMVSTGARSAVVMLVRQDVSGANAAALEIPPRKELSSLLSSRFLWLVDDKRAAQWVAYVDVRTPPTPLQPFGLTLLEVRKNPNWQPSTVSDPISSREDRMHPSLRLAEQNQQLEESRGSKN